MFRAVTRTLVNEARRTEELLLLVPIELVGSVSSLRCFYQMSDGSE